MTNLAITRHAKTRMSQRGIRESDLEVLLAHGTEIGGGRIMLTKRAVGQAIGELKRQIATLERLKNTVMVIAEDSVVTVYPQSSGSRLSRGVR